MLLSRTYTTTSVVQPKNHLTVIIFCLFYNTLIVSLTKVLMILARWKVKKEYISNKLNYIQSKTQSRGIKCYNTRCPNHTGSETTVGDVVVTGTNLFFRSLNFFWYFFFFSFVALYFSFIALYSSFETQGDWGHVIQLNTEHRLPVNISVITFPSRFQLQIWLLNLVAL